MLHVGDTAPDFELPDQYGASRRLSTLLADGPLALFWYPGALTSGCTEEACYFRDLASEFAAAGAQRVGISMDTVEAQKTFSDKNSFDYPLLADVDGSVAEAYGVRQAESEEDPVLRATFVIGTDRKVLRALEDDRSMEIHADEALAALRS